MTCSNPFVSSEYRGIVTTDNPNDGRYTVVGNFKVAQRVNLTKGCINKLMFKGYAHGGSINVDIFTDVVGGISYIKQVPGSRVTGITISTLVTGENTIIFNPPLQVPSTGYYHIVFSSAGGSFTFSKFDGWNCLGCTINEMTSNNAGGWWNNMGDVLWHLIEVGDISPGNNPVCGGFDIL